MFQNGKDFTRTPRRRIAPPRPSGRAHEPRSAHDDPPAPAVAGQSRPMLPTRRRRERRAGARRQVLVALSLVLSGLVLYGCGEASAPTPQAPKITSPLRTSESATST